MHPLHTLALGLFAGIAIITASPLPSSNIAHIGQSCGPLYSGTADKFPGKDQWQDFTTLFNANKNNMFSTGDVGEDIGRMWNSINWAARDTGIDQSVILAIILQESAGNVGVQCTPPESQIECGLMQVWGGPGFPYQHSLTQDQISSMVYAGAWHFKGNLGQEGNGDDAGTIYKALRLYNSGSIDENNLSNGLGATDSYVSDVANRLTGSIC